MDRSEEICPHGLYGHKYIEIREMEREDRTRKETSIPPTKKEIEIIETEEVGENVVAKIKYQKEIKIYIFRKTTSADMFLNTYLKSIDPISSSKVFAQFEPTKKGWEAAMFLARRIT